MKPQRGLSGLKATFKQLILPSFPALSLMMMVLYTDHLCASTTEQLAVEVVKVSASHQYKQREFVGIINIGGLIDISAPASGIVTEFNNQLGSTVQASERLAAIKNLDELYNDVVIKSPDSGIRIVRTYVEKGNFVEKHQKMMVLTKDIYYETKVQLVASEVGYFKGSERIEVIVHPNSPQQQSYRIAESRIEIPDQQNLFYNARLKLACPQTRCEDIALAGAIVKVIVNTPAEIQISTAALLQNGKLVAVVNSAGVIEHQMIKKGRVTSHYVEVLEGLKLNEQLVVGYNHPPQAGEVAFIKPAKSDQIAALSATE